MNRLSAVVRLVASKTEEEKVEMSNPTMNTAPSINRAARKSTPWTPVSRNGGKYSPE